MNEENDILELLTKARESLKAAEMLFDGEFKECQGIFKEMITENEMSHIYKNCSATFLFVLAAFYEKLYIKKCL